MKKVLMAGVAVCALGSVTHAEVKPGFQQLPREDYVCKDKQGHHTHISIRPGNMALLVKSPDGTVRSYSFLPWDMPAIERDEDTGRWFIVGAELTAANVGYSFVHYHDFSGNRHISFSGRNGNDDFAMDCEQTYDQINETNVQVIPPPSRAFQDCTMDIYAKTPLEIRPRDFLTNTDTYCSKLEQGGQLKEHDASCDGPPSGNPDDVARKVLIALDISIEKAALGRSNPTAEHNAAKAITTTGDVCKIHALQDAELARQKASETPEEQAIIAARVREVIALIRKKQ